MQKTSRVRAGVLPLAGQRQAQRAAAESGQSASGTVGGHANPPGYGPLGGQTRPSATVCVRASCATLFGLWTMLPLLRGHEEGPLTVTPEATAIELLGVWPCRVENRRLDGRRNEDQY